MTWLFNQLGSCFLVTVFFFSRVFAVCAGLLCIYYVNMSLDLKGEIRTAFSVSAVVSIAVAVVITTISSFYQTDALRLLVTALHRKEITTQQLQRAAAQQAIRYPASNARWEATYDPFITIIPICVCTWFWVHPPLMLLVQVFVAGFLGLGCIILATFFLSERCLEPVVSYLLSQGVEFEFDSETPLTLKRRMQLGFGTTILITAIMIGGLAIQRAWDILNDPYGMEAAVDNLFVNTVLITLIAFVVGVTLANTVSGSITQRVENLVTAMQQVQAGDLSLRLQPAGNDEIDTLARQFNLMVEELHRNDQSLRELTENLEILVEQKTGEVRASFDQLSLRNNELEDALSQLRLMQNQLVQSEKMTSLGQLVAGIAHEINNSINVVHNGVPSLVNKLGRIQNLITLAIDPQQSASELAQIEKSFRSMNRLTNAIGNGAERTAKIVRDMKRFSHPGTRERVGVDVNEALDRCLNLLQVSKLSSLNITRNYAALPIAVGSLGQLDQVILNIFSNAIDALDQVGNITISTRIHTASHEEAAVLVSIADDGPGVDAEAMRHLFDPFFTTKPPGKGTGLGLSISYSIVKQFGGRLTCNSQPGSGAEFVIEIPLTVALTS